MKKIKYNLNKLPDLLTITEVANLFQVTNLTVKRWGKYKDLPFTKANSRGDKRYKKQDITNFIQNIINNEQEY